MCPTGYGRSTDRPGCSQRHRTSVVRLRSCVGEGHAVRPTFERPRVPLRPGWGADADGESARGGVEGDVRRLLEQSRANDRRAVRAVRCRWRLRAVRRRQAARRRYALVPCRSGYPAPGGNCGRPGRGADGARTLETEERDCGASTARKAHRTVRGIGALRASRSRRQPAHGGRLVQSQLPAGPCIGRHRRTCSARSSTESFRRR